MNKLPELLDLVTFINETANDKITAVNSRYSQTSTDLKLLFISLDTIKSVSTKYKISFNQMDIESYLIKQYLQIFLSHLQQHNWGLAMGGHQMLNELMPFIYLHLVPKNGDSEQIWHLLSQIVEIDPNKIYADLVNKRFMSAMLHFGRTIEDERVKILTGIFTATKRAPRDTSLSPFRQAYEIVALTSIKQDFSTKNDIPISGMLAYVLDNVEANNNSIVVYKHFVNQFIRLNAKVVDPRHHRDVKSFLGIYEPWIIQFVYMLGADAFVFFEQYLVGTDTLKLVHMLEKVPMLDKPGLHLVKSCYQFHAKTINLKQSFKIIEAIVFLLGTSNMIRTNILALQPGSQLPRALQFSDLDSSRIDSLSNINKQIQDYFQQLLCYYLGITPGCINENQFYSVIPFLPNIIGAHLAMQQSPYRDVFRQMLQLDLSGQSVTHWMRDESQKSALGQALAKHNLSIKMELEHCKINAEMALNYSRNITFSINYATISPSHSNFYKTMQTMLQDLRYLAQLLEKEPLLSKRMQLGKLSCHIEQCLNNVNRQRDRFNIENQANSILLKKIHDKITLLARNPKLTEDDNWREFFEFSGHFMSRYLQLLQDNQKDITSSDLSQDKTFIIEQWNKDKVSTLWLGNDVGCCMATNGAQFPALIQRRMDDAMFFHVVKEADTQKPVALTWLYFAQDQDHPEQVYVMANFIEMASTYAKNNDKQAYILYHLLDFTEQYSSLIGAAGFLINHLRYGWIEDFNCFQTKNMTPIKLGGYLHLEEQDKLNAPSYYIDSINWRSFHLFERGKFQPKMLGFSNLSGSSKLVNQPHSAIASNASHLDLPEKLIPLKSSFSNSTMQKASCNRSSMFASTKYKSASTAPSYLSLNLTSKT